MVSNATDTMVTFGAVKSDGTPDIGKVLHRLPVPPRAMQIKQKIRADKAKARGRSGEISQSTGYEAVEITINLTLVDDEDGVSEPYTALMKMKEMQTIFRDRSKAVGDGKTPRKIGKDVPRVYSIQSLETDALGVKTVRLTVLDFDVVGNGSSTIHATLELKEWNPPATTSERRKKETVNESLDGGGGYTGAEGYSGYETDEIEDAALMSIDESMGTESAFDRGRREAKLAAMGGL